MFKYLRRKLPDGQIPSEARMLGLAMLFVNLPALVYGILFCWILLPLPGLILYGYCVSMTCNELSFRLSKKTTILTIIYHGLLLCIASCFFPSFHATDFMNWSYVAAIPFSTICFGALLLRVLKESKTHPHENA